MFNMKLLGACCNYGQKRYGPRVAPYYIEKHLNLPIHKIKDNPLTNTYNFGVHNYHRYITLTGHFFGGTAFICNRTIYDSWPKDFKDTFNAIGKLATEYQWNLATKEDELTIQKLSIENNLINEITDDQKKIFVHSVKPVLEKYRQSISPEIFSMLEEN
jgi:TRAP-type C4-dicarboxylate transport system substrate-binding protein